MADSEMMEPAFLRNTILSVEQDSCSDASYTAASSSYRQVNSAVVRQRT